jgi:hypothetical protein
MGPDKPTLPPALMKRKKADKMNGVPHVVPLAPQAVALLCELMTKWADYLDRLREGAQVIPLQGRAA